MYATAVKSKNIIKNRAAANRVAQKKNNVKKGFGFVDNRPEIARLKKLQRTISNSKLSPLPIQRVVRSLSEAKNTINAFYVAMLNEKTPEGASYGIKNTDIRGREYWYYNCGFPVKKLGDDYVTSDDRNRLRTWWTGKGRWWNTGSAYDNVKYMAYDTSGDQVLFNFHLYYK